jgi:hypothetical protein
LNNGQLPTTASLSPAKPNSKQFWLENLLRAQRPLFWGPKGGRCRQVWLYMKYQVDNVLFSVSASFYPVETKSWKKYLSQFESKSSMPTNLHAISFPCIWTSLVKQQDEFLQPIDLQWWAVQIIRKVILLLGGKLFYSWHHLMWSLRDIDKLIILTNW